MVPSVINNNLLYIFLQNKAKLLQSKLLLLKPLTILLSILTMLIISTVKYQMLKIKVKMHNKELMTPFQPKLDFKLKLIVLKRLLAISKFQFKTHEIPAPMLKLQFQISLSKLLTSRTLLIEFPAKRMPLTPRSAATTTRYKIC
jgi:hypothetical protein